MGTILVAGSAVAYSFAGYFTRLIPLDVVSLLFWRGLFAGLALTALLLAQHGRGSVAAIRAIGWPGVAVAAMSAICAGLYIAALRATSVADVSIIYATVPLVTAGMAWLLLGEREGPRMIVASLVALAGSAVMIGGALGSGHLLGDAMALTMTVMFALVMVLVRGRKRVSMVPAMALCGFMIAAAAAPFAKTGPIADLPMLQLALFGGLQLGGGLALLMAGMRRISATRAALVSLLDAPLAPAWVWLAFGEVPSTTTLIGGFVILAAVIWHMSGAPQKGASVPPIAGLRPKPACPM